MNSLCITGYLPIDLGLVEGILTQAGMQPARPAQRDSSMSISVWHQQVESILAKNDYDDKDELGSITNLGRLWEQLASDIFISNLHSPIWGWADTKSANLLTFWKNFDPQLRFILVVCSPERLIAHAIEESEDSPNVDRILDEWKSHYHALIQFHKANERRSILVNIQDCIDQPVVFLQTINKKWKLQLNKVHFPNIPRPAFSDLTRYLAAGLVRESKKNHEGQGAKISANLALNSTGSRNDPVPSHSDLMRWYRNMRLELLQYANDNVDAQERHKHDIQRLSDEKAATSALAAQNFLLERKHREQTVEIDRLNNEVIKLQNSRLSQEEQINRYQDIEIKLNQSLKDCVELHAKLEEAANRLVSLESQIKDDKKQTVEIERLNDEVIKLQNSRLSQEEQINRYQGIEIKLNQSLKDCVELQAKLEEAANRLVSLESQLKDDKTSLTDTIEMCAALTLQRDEAFHRSAELERKAIESNAELQSSMKARDYQIQLVNDLTEKFNFTNSNYESLILENKELQVEKDLLLLQLHQVQEELETYFLKYQEVNKNLDLNRSRWRRMLVSNPDYCDVESIELESITADKTHRIYWKIKGLDVGGRHIPKVLFSTFIEKGIAVIEFSRINSVDNGLIRWPVSLSEEEIITISSQGDAITSQKRALALIGLATNDWALLTVLISLIRKELSNPLKFKVLQNFNVEILIKALNKLEINLKAIPDVLRYDKVKLKREQVNPDYEHLWFAFENMKYSGKTIGDFEYRISCANVRPQQFGGHPKIEFPEETCKNVIHSWFDESYDDYGAKLELRFALPESMDMEVWAKLNSQDQLFIRELVCQLPDVMEDLRMSGFIPRRGWNDWKKMANETRRVLITRIDDRPQPISGPARKSNLPKKRL